MDRVAVFVDAGYLFAQGSTLLAGRKLPRGEIVINHEAAIRVLAEFATRISSLPLLRVYWYDGTSTGPTPQHLTFAHLPNTKVRLGFINSVGEQKGVDSLIVTDMINLARNHAMADAVLLSGDEDLRVGVQQAQELGVRVHLLGIKPSRGSQSLFLLQEADSVHEWVEVDVGSFLTCSPGSAAASQPATTRLSSYASTSSLEDIALQIAAGLEASEISSLLEFSRSGGQIPREVDGRLLARSRVAIGHELNPAEKRQVRDAFLRSCRSRMPS